MMMTDAPKATAGAGGASGWFGGERHERALTGIMRTRERPAIHGGE
jgi:hypothetical protein